MVERIYHAADCVRRTVALLRLLIHAKRAEAGLLHGAVGSLAGGVPIDLLDLRGGCFLGTGLLGSTHLSNLDR